MPFGRCPEAAGASLLSGDETVLLAAPPGLARDACLSALRAIGGTVREVDAMAPTMGPQVPPHLLRVAVVNAPAALADAFVTGQHAAPLIIVGPPTMTHLDVIADEPADRVRFVAEPVTPWRIRAAVAAILGRVEAAIGQFIDQQQAEQGDQKFAGLRVLLAEDNPVNQQVAQELLEGWGLQVTIAATGAEALERLEQSSFDLVLMDVQMPVMDGYEATRRIRQNHLGATLPVVAMTAHAMTGHLDRCLQAGMNDYVVKPIDPRHLYALIARWCPAACHDAGGGAASAPVAGDELADLAPEIDAASGLRHTNGNRGMLIRALQKFRADAGATTENIRRLSARGDFAALRGVVHSLKGSAATMGMTDVAAAAQAMDALLRGPDEAPVDGPGRRVAAEHLAAQLDAVSARLANWTPPADSVRSGPAAIAPPASVHPALSRAVELLADGDVAAIEVLEALAPTFKDGPWAGDYRRLREDAEAFDFDAALLVARGLLAQIVAAPSPIDKTC
jgi:CheY-like chemotaxis protein